MVNLDNVFMCGSDLLGAEQNRADEIFWLQIVFNIFLYQKLFK